MSGSAKAVVGARIFDGSVVHENCALTIRGDAFGPIVPDEDIPAEADILQLDGGVVAPGFVDLQVNGGGGIMFNDAPSPDGLAKIADAHATLGATSILPTLITDTPDVTRRAIEATQAAIARGTRGIVGLHLEGPHLSRARKGAHDATMIRAMTADDLEMMVSAAHALPVLMVTVAPESVTSAQIGALADAGAIVSLGHTDATHDAAGAAVTGGARAVTHLFNAMSQLGNREPGLVGAALWRGELSAGLIADGRHVHPATMAFAMAAKRGPGRLFLVSDAMATAGSSIDHFMLGGRRIERRDGLLTLADGTLAGADLDLATAIRNVVALGVPEADAMAMATSIPAAVIDRADRIGAIRPGRSADFVHLDRDGKLAGVWRGGESIVPAETPADLRSA